jgi:ParB family chromosome partitioning protein
MSLQKKPTGLGKGLGALLPSIEFSDKGFKFAPSEESDGSIAHIDVAKIEQNPYQPRKDFNDQALVDLTNSIKEHGIIQPVTVRRTPTGYELIAGERRLRASIAAGLHKIPAYILEVQTDVEMLEFALIENVQRENLNPIEIANGYNRLIEDCNLTQEQVAEKVGKDRATVANFLRLLKLPVVIQDSLRQKEVTMGHARALLALSNKDKIITAWHYIVDNAMSVRATEAFVRDVETNKVLVDGSKPVEEEKSEKFRKPSVTILNPILTAIIGDCENRLRHIFASQVRIIPKTEDSGKIEIEFYSKDDFERIMEMLTNGEL